MEVLIKLGSLNLIYNKLINLNDFNNNKFVYQTKDIKIYLFLIYSKLLVDHKMSKKNLSLYRLCLKSGTLL